MLAELGHFVQEEDAAVRQADTSPPPVRVSPGRG
jgi:hypothetical protein